MCALAAWSESLIASPTSSPDKVKELMHGEFVMSAFG
jgi:hypothetical protein